MDRRLVQSSNVTPVGYDAPPKTLEVEFRSCGLYHYSGVPETIYQGFMRATPRTFLVKDKTTDQGPGRGGDGHA